MTIGACLQELRKEKGWRLRKLAKKSGITAAYLEYLEGGLNFSTGNQIKPQRVTLFQILYALELKPTEIQQFYKEHGYE